MLLDDPSKFTITRGVAMLDSSEVPRQHLMAGSVVATIPVPLEWIKTICGNGVVAFIIDQ